MVYYGAGLQAGQCGATIDSVKEENNGEVQCSVGIETEPKESSATMPLTVASKLNKIFRVFSIILND